MLIALGIMVDHGVPWLTMMDHGAISLVVQV